MDEQRFPVRSDDGREATLVAQRTTRTVRNRGGAFPVRGPWRFSIEGDPATPIGDPGSGRFQVGSTEWTTDDDLGLSCHRGARS